MSRQEKWNINHRKQCKVSQKKYMKKIFWEAKMYRKLKKSGQIV